MGNYVSDFSSAFGGLTPRPSGAPPLDPAGGLPSPDPLVCPNPCCLATPLVAHDASIGFFTQISGLDWKVPIHWELARKPQIYLLTSVFKKSA